tara:strand:- start:514 stop:1461 length:948 start_codon:yes stop_codon:yes gene_type:complete
LINFLYCFDKNYNVQACVSIFSLLENISEKINIHIIHKEPETFKNIPNKISSHRYLSSLNIYKFENTSFDFPNIEGTHVSEATYYRFFIEDFIDPQIKNLVYLDSDIVCINNPLDEIKNVIKEIDKSDLYISAKSEPDSISNNLNLSSGKYFNAGVMIINIQSWYENQLESKLINLAEKFKDNIQFWDQDILNIYFDGQYLDLSKYMNYTLDMVPFEKNIIFDIDELDKIKLIHYVGKFKPWSLKGIVNSKSEFYQNNYRLLFEKKYHLQSSWKINTIRDLLKSLSTGLFFKSRYPFSLLVSVFYSLIKIRENKN